MNLKALIKSLILRKFNTGLLLVQLALTMGLVINTGILAMDTKAKLQRNTNLPLDDTLLVAAAATSGAFNDQSYYQSIVEQDLVKLEQIPGVTAAAPSIQLPIQWGGTNGNLTDVENTEATKTDRDLRYVAFYLSNHKLAEIFDLDLVEGRYLDEGDRASWRSPEEKNIILTESLKNALYPGESALGKLTTSGRVVGVVEDFLNNPGLADNKQYAMFSNAPVFMAGITQYYIISVAPGQLDSVKQQLRDVILAVQPERDIFQVISLREHMDEFYQTDQGLVTLFNSLAGLMLLLTAISSYTYAQFHMTQQSKLIGIRRALGARKKDIMLYVLTENWLVYALGSALGLVAAFGFNILLSQYIELSKPGWVLLASGMGILFVASTLATWVPAKKTSSIPPVIATKTV